MARKVKVREITIIDEGGAFATFFKRFTGESGDYDFEGVAALRNLLSNQKAKILHTIKTKRPASLYALARLLRRDFKSVMEDLKVLERFGFIDLIAEKTGKRQRLRPVVVIEELHIKIRL